MGSISSTYGDSTGEPIEIRVETTAVPTPETHEIVEPAAPEDVRILNWIGKFIKPMEERINVLERQVEILLSLQNQPSVEVRTKTQE